MRILVEPTASCADKLLALMQASNVKRMRQSVAQLRLEKMLNAVMDVHRFKPGCFYELERGDMCPNYGVRAKRGSCEAGQDNNAKTNAVVFDQSLAFRRHNGEI